MVICNVLADLITFFHYLANEQHVQSVQLSLCNICQQLQSTSQTFFGYTNFLVK